jgi:hypothetical protein
LLIVNAQMLSVERAMHASGDSEGAKGKRCCVVLRASLAPASRAELVLRRARQRRRIQIAWKRAGEQLAVEFAWRSAAAAPGVAAAYTPEQRAAINKGDFPWSGTRVGTPAAVVHLLKRFHRSRSALARTLEELCILPIECQRGIMHYNLCCRVLRQSIVAQEQEAASLVELTKENAQRRTLLAAQVFQLRKTAERLAVSAATTSTLSRRAHSSSSLSLKSARVLPPVQTLKVLTGVEATGRRAARSAQT